MMLRALRQILRLASRGVRVAILGLSLSSPCVCLGQDSNPAGIFKQFAEKGELQEIPGEDKGWVFLSMELEHLAEGKFWVEGGGQKAIDAISSYSSDLKAEGVELLLAPVPAKASIYPEKLSPKLANVKPSLAPFYKLLEDKGVKVMNLESLLRENREKIQTYAATDSHWSPLACQMVAEAIANKYKDAAWLKKDGGIELGSEEEISFKGDLTDEPQTKAIPRESLAIVRAGKKSGSKIATLAPDEAAPVVLLGDSHTLVWSEGADMHTTGAGLRDHLQQQFGFPIGLVANRGSGGDSARATLYRNRAAKNPTYWNSKKLVIWVFSEREFTRGKWRSIPIKKKK